MDGSTFLLYLSVPEPRQKTSNPMRKKLSILVLFTLVSFGVIQATNRYDFGAYSSSGHFLHYRIIRTLTVEVTCPYDADSIHGWDHYYGITRPFGNLVIDSVVCYNGHYYNVVSIGDNAFDGCSNLLSVSIPNCITSIGDGAFYSCNGLTSITIPPSVETIGDEAFAFCSSLSTVNFNARRCTYMGSNGLFPVFCGTIVNTINIGNNVTTIPPCAFAETEVTTIIIPNSVNSIGGCAFTCCRKLRSIGIPNSVTHIGANFLSWCDSLRNISLPTSITTIPHSAFMGSGLTNVTIPDSVTAIEDQAFSGCSNLSSITIPNSVTSIGERILIGCDRLSSPVYNNTIFVKLPVSYSGSYDIPDSIKTICGDAFCGCLGLTSVKLGNKIDSIGRFAFMSTGITGEFIIPANVKHIGFMGFVGCSGITGITCLGQQAPILELEGLYFVNPPYDYTIDSVHSEVFEGVDSNISVRIPCGARESYMEYWTYFSNIIETPFVVLTDNPEQGNIEYIQEPTCNNPTAVVRAIAEQGYHFDHWSDGSTQNPYTYTPSVKSDMTLIAYFALGEDTTGIETADRETDDPNVYADGGKIVVTGAEGEEVCLYDMMGRQIDYKQDFTSPLYFVVPAGIYLVRIGDKPARKVIVIR